MSRVLVTGGAGFIGRTMVDRLLSAGSDVVVYDDLSSAEPDWLEPFAPALASGRLRFVRADIRDLDTLVAATTGVALVVHLAANTDIPAGFADPRLDLEACILGTWNVAEAMRRTGVRELLYASSGVVYGSELAIPTAETSGPLRPESHYAAGKLAGEAILSGFASLYGWRALAFRFGNTVGAASNHGIVHDFVVKLMREPGRLEILGDGRQSKPFIHVDDLVEAILHAWRSDLGSGFHVLNVATEGSLSVAIVADLVIEALDLDPATIVRAFTGGAAGWPGDTPRVEFDTRALRGLGWRARHSAVGAVRLAAAGTRARLATRGGPLSTSIERREHHVTRSPIPGRPAA